VAQLPEIRAELELINKRLDLEKARSALLDANARSAEQIAAVWKDTAETQAGLLARKTPWWQHPYLWTAVGLVVGTGVTILVVYAVEAREANR
jgi:hypothetical protein